MRTKPREFAYERRHLMRPEGAVDAYSQQRRVRDRSQKGIECLSVTITDRSGRTLSGQTLDAFLASISHAPLLGVGFNFAFGPHQMAPFVGELARLCPHFVFSYPNAGLPNEFGGYDMGPQELATALGAWARDGWLNLVGGCCGTTPEHIAAIADAVL